MEKKNIVPVVLCGGSGTRLWPLSRENQPKQFLSLTADDTLLQQTVLRSLDCAGAEGRDLVTVTLDGMKKELMRELNELGTDMASHVLGEPVARNTAGAIAYAALYVRQHFGGDAIMWVLPSDHHVGNKKALAAALDKAVLAAQEGHLVTFGIEPTRPETGYGYIASGESLGADSGIFSVERFVEKPPKEDAQAFLDAGNYLWNSGMFVFRVDALLENYQKHAWEILNTVQHAITEGKSDKAISVERYEELPDQPFDKAIMEKTDKAAVVPCDPAWSDVGTWQSLWEISEQDASGNVLKGEVACNNCVDCMIHAEERLVACIGLKDVAVVETGDSVLVADRKDSDAMRTLVKALKKSGRRETIDPPKETRPWGMFKVLSESRGYKIKEIVVKPGEQLSLQSHNHRCEFWVVIQGEALVTVDEEEKTLRENEVVFIPLKARHRLANPGKVDLKIVEVQSGTYLGEDDIVRYEDVYGRVAAA